MDMQLQDVVIWKLNVIVGKLQEIPMMSDIFGETVVYDSYTDTETTEPVGYAPPSSGRDLWEGQHPSISMLGLAFHDSSNTIGITGAAGYAAVAHDFLLT